MVTLRATSGPLPLFTLFLVILSSSFHPAFSKAIHATNVSHHGLLARAPQKLSGRCTEFEPAVIEEFERRFRSDQAARGISLTQLQAQQQAEGNELSKRQGSFRAIPVHFHIIAADDTAQNGNVGLDQVVNQIQVLNDAYYRSGLRFVLVSYETTINADWFKNGGPDTTAQTEMKASLRKGEANALNIYTVDFTGIWSGLLGYATFPQSYEDNPADDGIVILYTTLPGGSMSGYDQGKTAVHETGHWTGLYHTFQGGCFAPGDYVDDTPPEGLPSESCVEGRITCPVQDVIAGTSDPIHNYMDYSPDSCMTEFTPYQTLRQRVMLAFYRDVPFS